MDKNKLSKYGKYLLQKFYFSNLKKTFTFISHFLHPMSRALLLCLCLKIFIISGVFAAPVQRHETKCDTALIRTLILRASDSESDSAIFLYNQAIQIAEKCLASGGSKSFVKKVSQKQIRAKLNLGLIFYQRIDYTVAIKLFSEALQEAQSIGETLLIAESHFNIAEVYLEQSQFLDAMESYHLSLLGYEKINDDSGQFWCLAGMGIVQKQSGNYKDAELFYNKALQKARNSGMTYEEAICHNNLGNMHRKTGDFSKAMSSYEKAIEVFRKMNDDAAVSDCLNNIGNLYSDNHNPFRALEYYSQALKIAEKLKDEYRLIIRYKNMAGAYTELKDFENAGLFLDDALKLAEKSGDKSFLASCNMLYGKLHSVKNNHSIATAFFKKSADLYAETGVRPEQCEALIELAFSLLRENNIKEALKYALEAFGIAESTGSLKARLEASICLAECYEKDNNPTQAYAFLKSANMLKDSIYTAEKYRTIEEIEAGFARSQLKKENEVLSQNAILQKQAIRTQNIIMLLLGVSLAMGLALIWLIYKRKNEARRETGEIKQRSEEEIGRLSKDLLAKERELTSKTVFINQKNQLIEKLIRELDELKKTGASEQAIQHLQIQLKQELAPNAWKEFEIQFNEVHPDFQARLLNSFPDLTPAERRLCAFIRLDMNTREISSLSGQSIKSIEVARTRIRKKLGVPHEQNLTNFIALI